MKKNFITALSFLLLLVFNIKILSSETGMLNGLKFSLSGIDNNEAKAFQQTSGIEEKSVSKALLFSLVVPGLGEKYVGKNKVSKYLVIGEVALWGLYIFHNEYGKWLKDDYKLFSREHANVNIEGKDKRYFVNIGNFFDIYGYNKKKRLDREDEFVYDDINDYYWRWDSDENKEKFKNTRIKSDEYNNRLNYFVTGIFLNHIVSGINAAISAKRFNKSKNAASNWKLEYEHCHPGEAEDIKITLKYRF